MKIKFLILCTSLFIQYSCSSSYYTSSFKNNSFVEGDMHYHYLNDSLKLAIQMFADYCEDGNDQYHNTTLKKDLSRDKKIIKANLSNIKLDKNNFVYTASTKVPPYYHMRVYALPKKKGCPTDLTVDSLSNTLIYCKESELYKYILLFQPDKQTETGSLNGLKNESSQIVNSIKTDSNYLRVTPPSPFNLAANGFEMDTANYLMAVNNLKKAEFNYKENNQRWFYLQASLTYNAFIQNNEEYCKLLTSFYKNGHDTNKVLKVSLSDSVAINYIVKQSSDKKVVMINEQHWQPKHRYLGNILLRKYYDQGFRYLAVEAIDEKDEEALNVRQYPLQESGFYTKDPQLSNMIRNALEMGFRVVAYDDFGKNREYTQAENIYKKTLGKDANAKVLIWAGIQHIDEYKSNNPKMAYYFKEISKVDPFTIEQTQGDYSSDLLKYRIGINADSTYRWDCDLFIYNNLKVQDYKINPTKEDTTITLVLKPVVIEKLAQHKKLILSIFYKSEFDIHRLNCIPILNRMVSNNSDNHISLPSNSNYIAVIRSPSGFIIDSYELIYNKHQ